MTSDIAIIELYKDVHFLVNGLIPLACAILIIALFCIWFYQTFCK